MKSTNYWSTTARLNSLVGFALLFCCAHPQAEIFTVDTTSDAGINASTSATCELTLIPTGNAQTSSGRCVLANSGALGAITINAVYDTLTGAFGDLVTGGNVTQSANFVIPSN